MTAPSMSEIVRVFGRIGLLSFGGPAAQISLMHRELVDERPWLQEQSFLRALSLSMLLPGPEAMQLATYAGWKLRGVAGGLIAGSLFVIPGAVVIAGLAMIYAFVGDVPSVQAAFSGIKAAVVVIVLQALAKVAGKALLSPLSWTLAIAAFLALFAVGLPYPLVILAAAGAGALLIHDDTDATAAPVAKDAHPFRTVLLWGALWAAPVGLVMAWDQAFLTQIALFFSKLAVVTFGGAYAVLAYMTQTIVADYGWISTEEMIDALGLAETTPGPLILVTQFVAMLAGMAQGGVVLSLLAGALALWVTFIPCFLWIFLAGPYLEIISSRPRLAAALAAITAAVVGVIFNLALWFGMHVLFNELRPSLWMAAPVPVWTTLDLKALGLTVVAAIMLIGLGRGIVQALVLTACAGWIASLI